MVVSAKKIFCVTLISFLGLAGISEGAFAATAKPSMSNANHNTSKVALAHGKKSVHKSQHKSHKSPHKAASHTTKSTH